MERLSGRQPLNWSVMEVEAVIEMQSVGRKEDQNCNETSNPPMLDRNDDDNEKILDALETTPFVDQQDNLRKRSIEKISEDHLSSTEEQGVRKALGEPLNWIFANNDMKRNYDFTNDSSVIEFIPEQTTIKRWNKACSLIQIPKPISSCQMPISFKMKIEYLGTNKLGNGDYGIELGFTKMLSEEESTFERGRRMKMGLWYDAFNGGIYNYRNHPEEFVDKTERNNVVEWRVEDVEEEDGVVKTKATLLLNNKNIGKSFVLDRSKDIHPSMYIGSRGAKVTIDVFGMGYTPTVIEYPDTTEDDCCSCVFSNCGLLSSCLAHTALFLAVYRLFTTCWMLGDITTDSLTTYEYFRFWKDFSGNLATANISGNITFNFTHYSKASAWQLFTQFLTFIIVLCPSIFFFSSVAIWMLTPLTYAINISGSLLILLFNWEQFKKEDHDEFYNKQMIRFLRMFNLSPEEVNSYSTSLKIIIVIPPFGIVTIPFISIVVFITLMCYSVFLAYVQFPLFAITVALKDVYKTASGGCKVKVDQVVKKSKTKSNRISKAKAICGLGIFYEEDIVMLKYHEAIGESFCQFLLSTVFFRLTKKNDLGGNLLIENVFIPDNAILLSSMIMSMVSIMIAINGWRIMDFKLEHGTGFYKNICLILSIVCLNHLLYVAFLLSFFIFFVVK